MLDPTLEVRKPIAISTLRRGAIAPLFAFIFPVLMIFAGFAINLAYMQLVTTELKIAADATCHAGGRAMSLRQQDPDNPDGTKQEHIAYALGQIDAITNQMAQANLVGGKAMSVGQAGSSSQIQLDFGRSVRSNNGYGMYDFSSIPYEEVSSGTTRPSSLAVTANAPTSAVFRMFAFKKGNYADRNLVASEMDWKKNSGNSDGKGILTNGLNDFNPVRRSIATQVDRDIALVLDRSGSMLYYQDEDALEDRLWELYNEQETVTTPGYYLYAYWKWSGWGWQWMGWHQEDDADPSWNNFGKAYSHWVNGTSVTNRRISWSEYNDATDWLYDRNYSNNVIYQLERYSNDNHTLGSTFSWSERSELTDPMAMYTSEWEYASGAPIYSRWYYLDLGVTAFLDVLDDTDQEELVSLVTFSSTATLDKSLQNTYDSIRTEVSSVTPYGGTAIGDGMTTGLPPIVNGSAARPFAAKTIVVLTDGENNSGEDPEEAVESIVAGNAVTIHTVTFSYGADQDAMEKVAIAGHGRHYHANDGSALVHIFEEIANNLPTILTE
jgi:Flp pilus assembly protein TadG